MKGDYYSCSLSATSALATLVSGLNFQSSEREFAERAPKHCPPRRLSIVRDSNIKPGNVPAKPITSTEKGGDPSK